MKLGEAQAADMPDVLVAEAPHDSPMDPGLPARPTASSSSACLWCG